VFTGMDNIHCEVEVLGMDSVRKLHGWMTANGVESARFVSSSFLFSLKGTSSSIPLVVDILIGQGGERSDCSFHFDHGTSIDQTCHCPGISNDGCIAFQLYFSISCVNFLFVRSL